MNSKVSKLMQAESKLIDAANLIKQALGDSDVTDEYVREIHTLCSEIGADIADLETPTDDAPC